MACKIRVLADDVMAGLPWALVRVGEDVTVCVRESECDREALIREAAAGAQLLLPVQRKSEN